MTLNPYITKLLQLMKYPGFERIAIEFFSYPGKEKNFYPPPSLTGTTFVVKIFERKITQKRGQWCIEIRFNFWLSKRYRKRRNFKIQPISRAEDITTFGKSRKFGIKEDL